MTDAVERTTVDPTVIAGIAAIAATQVDGVWLPVATVPPVGSVLGADPEPPVRSWCADDGSVGVALTIEVVLPGPGGPTVLALADGVRREVVAALAAMTRLRVSTCDVHVADLVEPVGQAGAEDQHQLAERVLVEAVPATAPVVLAPLVEAQTGAVLDDLAPREVPTFDELVRAADAEGAAAGGHDEPGELRVVPPRLRSVPPPRTGQDPAPQG